MSLFFDEEEAIKELQSRGYRIVKTDLLEGASITTIRHLVDYFYSRRKFYNPDRSFPYSIDYTEDTKYVSSFIKSRQKLGLDRKAAVAEAAKLVDALFRYEKHLNLKAPVISPAILAVRPIMDRICSFVNGEVSNVNEYETELYMDQVNEYYNKNYAQKDFQRAAEERTRIQEKLNVDKERERRAPERGNKSD
jgi:leucyl-tRNA synthetase